MRAIPRRAAMLLTGALLWSLPGCGRPTAPAAAEEQKPAPAVTARAQSDEPPKDEADDGFRFPDDKGGRMLAQVLPPADKAPAPAENVPPTPQPLPGAPDLEQPSVPLAPVPGQVPRLPPGRTGPPLRPRSLPEGLPPAAPWPEPPQPIQLPAGDRVRLPGPDVNRPALLPPLAAPAPDRTALDDPTADFSAAAAQSGAVPARQAPAPFAKVGLPDPFENRNAVKLREAPPEKGDPVTAAPRPPGK
jgi:hypothetical protein